MYSNPLPTPPDRGPRSALSHGPTSSPSYLPPVPQEWDGLTPSQRFAGTSVLDSGSIQWGTSSGAGIGAGRSGSLPPGAGLAHGSSESQAGSVRLLFPCRSYCDETNSCCFLGTHSIIRFHPLPKLRLRSYQRSLVLVRDQHVHHLNFKLNFLRQEGTPDRFHLWPNLDLLHLRRRLQLPLQLNVPYFDLEDPLLDLLPPLQNPPHLLPDLNLLQNLFRPDEIKIAVQLILLLHQVLQTK